MDEREVRCPVLVVSRRKDRITPASVVRKVALKYAAAYREFPDNAHWVIQEPGWRDVAGFVAGWLEGLWQGDAAGRS